MGSVQPKYINRIKTPSEIKTKLGRAYEEQKKKFSLAPPSPSCSLITDIGYL